MRWTAARPPAPLQACCRWLRLVRDCLESTETAVLDVPRQHELQERWVAVSCGAPAADAAPPAALYSHLIVATATIGLCYAAHSGFMVCWDIYLTGVPFCHEIANKLIGVWHFSVLHLSYLWVFSFICIWTRGASCLKTLIFQYFWLKFSRDQVSI